MSLLKVNKLKEEIKKIQEQIEDIENNEKISIEFNYHEIVRLIDKYKIDNQFQPNKLKDDYERKIMNKLCQALIEMDNKLKDDFKPDSWS